MSYSTTLGEQHDVTLRSGPVRYRDTGAGDVVVFVHGLLANGDLWREVVPRIVVAGYRCITPDWPLGAHELGMGPEADLSLPGLARIVEELLEQLDLNDVTLVANDTGGAIVQCLLARGTSRVRRVVLTPCDAFENFLPKILGHLYVAGRYPAGLWIAGQSLRSRFLQRLPIAFGFATLRPIDPAAMKSYTAPLRTNAAVRRDFSKLIRAVSSRHTLEAAGKLEDVSVDALIVWSSHDRLFPLDHGKRLAALLGAEPVTLVEDSAAFIPEDQPGALADAVLQFLGSTSTRRPASAPA